MARLLAAFALLQIAFAESESGKVGCPFPGKMYFVSSAVWLVSTLLCERNSRMQPVRSLNDLVSTSNSEMDLVLIARNHAMLTSFQACQEASQ
jgi:hypothetical protein